MRNEHERRADASSAGPSYANPSSTERARDAGDDLTDHLLRFSVEERPFWAGLFESLRDTLFPVRLPALELTSTPIPAPDRMAGRTNPWAIGTATVMNAGLVALVILLGLRTTIGHYSDPFPGRDTPLKDFTLIAPGQARGGGSGGDRELTDPILGHLPPRADVPIAPAQVPLIQNPKITLDRGIAVPPDAKLPDNPLLPNIGAHDSPNVKLGSHGPGGPGGIGGGPHGGGGPGDGSDYGPGKRGGFGDSIYMPGVGGVSKPVLVFSRDAEFSDQARRQKYEGACIISIIVDARGYPQNPRVTRALGMGLDEKALEAVQRYRFKPAMKDGKPVASFVSVEIDFHLY